MESVCAASEDRSDTPGTELRVSSLSPLLRVPVTDEGADSGILVVFFGGQRPGIGERGISVVVFGN